jgi:hypothetical protein
MTHYYIKIYVITVKSVNSTKPVNSNMSFGTRFAFPYDNVPLNSTFLQTVLTAFSSVPRLCVIRRFHCIYTTISLHICKCWWTLVRFRADYDKDPCHPNMYIHSSGLVGYTVFCLFVNQFTHFLQHAPGRQQIHTHSQLHIHACTYTHTHTRARTHTHTHTHTHTQTQLYLPAHTLG